MAILPYNEEKEIKDYCEKLTKELEEIGLRVKIFSKDKLRDRIRQMYQKKVPYYLVIGGQEIEKKILRLINVYQGGEKEEINEKELYNKLNRLNKQIA